MLCLSISSRLSGAYFRELSCAREYAGSVRVVDTLTTAGGLYLLVRAARDLLDAGYSLEETACMVEQLRPAVQTRFSVGDMEPLRRSGPSAPCARACALCSTSGPYSPAVRAR